MPSLSLPIPSKARQAELIDEFGDLGKQIEAHKPTKDRYDQLRGQIQGWYDTQPAEQAFIQEGARYSLEISEKASKRSITKMTTLFKILGQRLFLKLCGFALADVDENIPISRHKEFLTEAKTGPRKLKAIAKVEIDQRKAA